MMGSASAFMITDPAIKITNLDALKNVLGMKQSYPLSCIRHGVLFGHGLIANLVLNLIHPSFLRLRW